MKARKREGETKQDNKSHNKKSKLSVSLSELEQSTNKHTENLLVAEAKAFDLAACFGEFGMLEAVDVYFKCSGQRSVSRL